MQMIGVGTGRLINLVTMTTPWFLPSSPVVSKTEHRRGRTRNKVSQGVTGDRSQLPALRVMAPCASQMKLNTVDPVDYLFCFASRQHSSFRNDHRALTEPVAHSLSPSPKFDKKKLYGRHRPTILGKLAGSQTVYGDDCRLGSERTQQSV